MNAKYIDGLGSRMVIVIAAIVAAGCATQSTATAPPSAPPRPAAAAAMAADRGFNITFQGACPNGVHRFGPPGSECPGNADDCVQVQAGQPVLFARATGAPDNEFVIHFTAGSPLEDGNPKVSSANGKLQEKTRSPAPSPPKNAFPFEVQAPHGSNCPNVDPQIILN